jgi:two-component system nitrogen regulation sensor histidine kinase NtrY
MKNKFADQVSTNEKDNFKENLKIINNQIKQIEKLVNQFSDFARMPKPILRENNLVIIFRENIKLLNELDKSINIDFKCSSNDIVLNCDNEQLSRVFFNLIKNSIESIQQRAEKDSNFSKNISIDLTDHDDHIKITMIDSGIGFGDIASNIKDILNPYFTTKKNGTGLGLSIVNKIVNDHDGKIDFIPIDNGAKIEILFKK